MTRTTDEAAADARLEQAITQAAKTYGIVQDGEILAQWVVVLTAVGGDEGRTIYGRIVPGGSQPQYVTVGLLRVAEHDLLTEGEP